MAYIGTQPKDIRSFGKAKFDFTATQGQTAFTGADDDGKTLGFTAGQVSVYVNGILMDDSDYTASNGNTITLTSAANASDIISVVALQTDIPNSDYVPATGGTFSGAVTHTGAFTSRGIDDNATSTAMTLDASGNLLVGTTDTSLYNNTSGGGFHVSPNGFTEVAYESANAADPTFLVNNTGADGDIIQLRKDGTVVGSIGASGGDLLVGTGDTAVRFVDADDALVPFNTNGSGRDAAIDLGASTERFKNLYLSGGVYLGGTGAANLLDDYEEGEWWPTIYGHTSGSLTLQQNSPAKYVKIGRFVHVSCFDLIWTANSGLVGNVCLGGLPFASDYNRYNIGTFGGSGGGMSISGLLNAGLDPNVSFAWVMVRSMTNNTYIHTPTFGSSGSIYGFTMSYQTAA